MASKIQKLIEAEDWPAARRAIRAELRSDPVYLLERTGYVKVKSVRAQTDSRASWTAKLSNMEPTCFDAEGSATTLRSTLYAEEQREWPPINLDAEFVLDRISRIDCEVRVRTLVVYIDN
jgi:hypothetical protein